MCSKLRKLEKNTCSSFTMNTMRNHVISAGVPLLTLAFLFFSALFPVSASEVPQSNDQYTFTNDPTTYSAMAGKVTAYSLPPLPYEYNVGLVSKAAPSDF